MSDFHLILPGWPCLPVYYRYYRNSAATRLVFVQEIGASL